MNANERHLISLTMAESDRTAYALDTQGNIIKIVGLKTPNIEMMVVNDREANIKHRKKHEELKRQRTGVEQEAQRAQQIEQARQKANNLKAQAERAAALADSLEQEATPDNEQSTKAETTEEQQSMDLGEPGRPIQVSAPADNAGEPTGESVLDPIETEDSATPEAAPAAKKSGRRRRGQTA